MNVHVSMAAQGFMIGGNVTVNLDGQDVAFVGGGQTISLPCSNGEHTITLKCSFRSASVRFHATQDVMVSAQFSRLSGSIKMCCIGSDVEIM